MPGPPPSILAPMVQKLGLRSYLGKPETEALLNLPCRPASNDAGSHLIREGDRAETCIVLLTGFVYRSKTTRQGGRQILSIHLRGDLVDLQNCLLDEADNSVQALTQIEAAHIPRHALLALAERYPLVARALWRDTMVDGSVFREWILNVGRRDARQRIAHLLCELALRQEAAGICTGPEYEWPMTQEQIGDATGLTSVHVNRVLQGLRQERMIMISRHSMTIIDWPRLQKAGDFRRAYLHPVVGQGSIERGVPQLAPSRPGMNLSPSVI